MKATAAWAAIADLGVLGHSVGFTQGDGSQAVGVHGLFGAGGQVAVGGLPPDEPEDGARWIVSR